MIAQWRAVGAVAIGLLLRAGQAEGRELELTYLANEGVLLRSGAQGVLVDALFGSGLDGYAVVAESERAPLEAASAPYDAVTLVLATHRHRDHFDPGAVARFLTANPRAHFLSTPQAVAELRAALGTTVAPDVAERIHASLPDRGRDERQMLGGVSLRVLQLHHGETSDTQNLGFVIELGGARVLHVGDTAVVAAELAPHRLDQLSLDAALLPIWYYSHAEYDEAVRGLAARRRFAFHVALPEAPPDYHGPADSFDGLGRLVAERAPGVELLTRPGQRVVIEAAAAR